MNILTLSLTLALGTLGCGEEDKVEDSQVETDADTDSDSDSDTDSDTDADSDSDTDSDTDADADADADSDTDSDADTDTGFVDNDGDGYGVWTDCDDNDEDVNPGASEVCDDKDNDCDGSVDNDATDATVWYQDSDGDGYGDSSKTTKDCDRVTGYVADDTDCDDSDSGVNPGADEECDGADNNCDGDTDEDDAANSYDSSDVQTIVNSKCSGCHTSSSSGNLNMSDVYDDTVNVASDDVSSMDLIEPGDTSNSYIWHKLQGTQSSVGGTGSDMPKGTTLSSEQECVIREWIEQGATE